MQNKLVKDGGYFFVLSLTKKPTDTKNTPRGVGNYVVGEDANGAGIRRYPYSYDMTINPLTYADMAANPEVHDIGEICGYGMGYVLEFSRKIWIQHRFV